MLTVLVWSSCSSNAVVVDIVCHNEYAVLAGRYVGGIAEAAGSDGAVEEGVAFRGASVADCAHVLHGSSIIIIRIIMCMRPGDPASFRLRF